MVANDLPHPMPPRPYIWRLLTLLWAVVIFLLSAKDFSGTVSRSLMARCFDFLGISLPSDLLDPLHLAMRKLAHLFEYTVFGFLLYRSLHEQDHPAWQSGSAAWALAIAAAYSLTDELHQASVPGRTASVMDCAIDSSGTLLALLLIYGFSLRSRRTAHH